MNQTALRPTTKNARHQCIIELVSQREVKSQGELAHLLAESGLHVTQATLSRDLDELDAVKVRGPSGALVYAVPGEGGDRRPTAPGASAAVGGHNSFVVLSSETVNGPNRVVLPVFVTR